MYFIEKELDQNKISSNSALFPILHNCHPNFLLSLDLLPLSSPKYYFAPYFTEKPSDENSFDFIHSLRNI